MAVLLTVALALLFDRALGEPRRWHPLVGFGHLASRLEKYANRYTNRNANRKSGARLAGAGALLVVIVPPVALAGWMEVILHPYTWMHTLFAALVLYLAIGWQSLLQHAAAVATPLANGNQVQARQAVAQLVSRDTRLLDEQGIAAAATESVLENGADALFSALFWFLIAGVPGVVCYRLSNTLDAMWGYKTPRFVHFGWCAARLDDVLNYIPARLTALSYALAGNTRAAWYCWRRQAGAWKSPNAGPVMAAGAGALNVTLGGQASYHNQQQARPLLGPWAPGTTGARGEAPSASTIQGACRLVNRSLGLWCIVILLGGMLCLLSR
jgi:adenosylcobinamide-phosphate synthase